MENHKFWKTQSIQDTSKKEKISEASIITNMTDDMFSRNPYDIPENYSWHELDPDNENDINDLFIFLYENYNTKGDDFGSFYSKESLKWYMSVPNKFNNLYICVKYKNKIVGSILCRPMCINIYDNFFPSSEASFLCIDNNIREKSLASIIIKEIMRRTYFTICNNIYYTSPLNLPNILCSSHYYHKILNIKKMMEINFITKPAVISFKSYEKLFKVSEKINTNIRKIKEEDIDKCMDLYFRHYKKYKMYQIMTIDEFKHKFIGYDNVIDTFVLEKNNEIICFVSLFYVKSRILGEINNKYTDYSIAQIYHYCYDDINLFNNFMEDVFVLMKQKNIDVINWIEQMDNKIFLNKFNFKEGSGISNYYFWNIKCPLIDNKQIGIVTL
jgi:glycylpeptide N-tetradecanoyltransferase